MTQRAGVSTGMTMIFRKIGLKGAYLIEPEKINDHRGFFARSFCVKEFEQYGLKTRFVQCNISYNIKRGTLRGLHYQNHPFPEVKLVRCSRGAIYDVIIDLRSESPSYKSHFGVRLDELNSWQLYVPEGFAHGFITLEDHSEISYQMSEYYSPQHSGGIRWDDPCFNIRWPLDPVVISDKDRILPHFSPPGP